MVHTLVTARASEVVMFSMPTKLRASTVATLVITKVAMEDMLHLPITTPLAMEEVTLASAAEESDTVAAMDLPLRALAFMERDRTANIQPFIATL